MRRKSRILLAGKRHRTPRPHDGESTSISARTIGTTGRHFSRKFDVIPQGQLAQRCGFLPLVGGASWTQNGPARLPKSQWLRMRWMAADVNRLLPATRRMPVEVTISPACRLPPWLEPFSTRARRHCFCRRIPRPEQCDRESRENSGPAGWDRKPVTPCIHFLAGAGTGDTVHLQQGAVGVGAQCRRRPESTSPSSRPAGSLSVKMFPLVAGGLRCSGPRREHDLEHLPETSGTLSQQLPAPADDSSFARLLIFVQMFGWRCRHPGPRAKPWQR